MDAPENFATFLFQKETTPADKILVPLYLNF